MTPFELPQHVMLRKMLREFCEKEVKPLAHDIDEQERFPIETVEKMKELGFFGINMPKEYGGAGCDDLAYALAVEELSRVCATTGVILSAHNSLCAQPILSYGSDFQKEQFLVPLVTGKWLGAFGLTEPNAGTDASGQQTTATQCDGGYIINGSKTFITNAGYADVYIIMAMTDSSKGTRGISAFIVEATTPGFKVGKKEQKLGIRGSSTCELFFDHMFIPTNQLLGTEGEGFKIAMNTLDGGRIGIAAQALGIAIGAFDEAVHYVKERKQFGRAIAAFQNTQFKLADMKTSIEASRLLVYQASVLKTLKQPYAINAAMAKLFASRTAVEVTDEAVQLLGGYGYIRDYPVERMFRDAKITEIYEGTSEVQRMVISSAILK